MSKFIDSLHIRTRKMVNYARAEIKSKETLMEVWQRFWRANRSLDLGIGAKD